MSKKRVNQVTSRTVKRSRPSALFTPRNALRAGRYVYKNRKAIRKALGSARKLLWPSQKGTLQKKKAAPAGFIADDLHSGKSRTKHVASLPGHKGNRKGKREHFFIYEQQNSGIGSCVPGQQQISSFTEDLIKSEFSLPILALPLPAEGVKQSQYRWPLLAQNPNIQPTGSVDGQWTNQGASATQYMQQRIYIKNLTYEVEVSNMSNTAADIVMYFVTPKKTTNASWQGNLQATGAILDMITYNNQNGALTAVNTTNINGLTTLAQYGHPTINTVGFSPFQLPAFRQAYKGLLKKEVNLASGAVHKFEIKIKVDKVVDTAWINSLASEGIPKVSIQGFFVYKGSPVVVKNSVGGVPATQENTSVTTSAIEIAWTCVKKIKGNFLSIGPRAVDNVYPGLVTYSGTTTGQTWNVVDQQQTAQVVF